MTILLDVLKSAPVSLLMGTVLQVIQIRPPASQGEVPSAKAIESLVENLSSSRRG